MADEGWVLEVTVTHLAGKQVHNVPVRPAEGETLTKTVLSKIDAIRQKLDEGKSLVLTHPPTMYPPKRILLLAFDLTNPNAKSQEIAVVMAELGIIPTD